MRIFLTGFMGSGKSQTGPALAKQFHSCFADLDIVIEQKNKKSVPEIFSLSGEETFREMERKCLQELIENNHDIVLSTGGGTPCFYDNMQLMNNSGITIYLRLPCDILFNRLKKTKMQRPLIADYSNKNLLHFIHQKLKEREKFYMQSRLTVDALTIKPDKLEQLIRLEMEK